MRKKCKDVYKIRKCQTESNRNQPNRAKEWRRWIAEWNINSMKFISHLFCSFASAAHWHHQSPISSVSVASTHLISMIRKREKKCDNQSPDKFRRWCKEEEEIKIKLYKAPHSFKWHDEDDDDDNDVDKEKYFKLPSRWVAVLLLRSLTLSPTSLSLFLFYHYPCSRIEHIALRSQFFWSKNYDK